MLTNSDAKQGDTGPVNDNDSLMEIEDNIDLVENKDQNAVDCDDTSKKGI